MGRIYVLTTFGIWRACMGAGTAQYDGLNRFVLDIKREVKELIYQFELLISVNRCLL